jgi:stress response protein SCP2/predicted type IV restriction endonuclease
MICLQRGGNVLLEKNNGGLDHIIIGLGWQTNTSCLNVETSAFMLNENGKVRDERDFIFYNQTKDINSCIVLDNSYKINNCFKCFRIQLSKIPTDIVKIVFVATIDKIENKELTFCMVENLHLNIIDDANQELIRYNIEDANHEVALIVGEIYLYKGVWKFKAVGQGYNGGLDIIISNFGVNINNVPSGQEQPLTLKKGRRSLKQILQEHSQLLKCNLEPFLPQIKSAINQELNESNTRMILDKIFMDVFGYSIEEIKAEQKIQGRSADYVLSINDVDAVVVEAKKAGMPLRHKQIFQATSYGAYSGIKWVLLTNLVTWQLYHISTQDRVDANLVFSIDVLPNANQDDLERLVFISRYWMEQKSALDKLYNEIKALSYESIIGAILTEDVINKIRLVIKRDTGCDIDNAVIQNTVEKILNI